MGQFETPLDVSFACGPMTAVPYRLNSKLLYRMDCRDAANSIEVPKDYYTDLGVIPWSLRSTILGKDRSCASIFVHDYIYASRGRRVFRSKLNSNPYVQYLSLTRGEADSFLRDSLRCCGVGWLRRNLAYLSARIFGRFPMRPTMFTKLNSRQVFVFGSNLAGRHGKGAALQARQDFGAMPGVGEGLTGHCYAFPTLDRNFRRRTPEELRKSRDEFFRVAESLPEWEFLLTKVGCGLAGYPESRMIELFRGAPKNIVPPVGWDQCPPMQSMSVQLTLMCNQCGRPMDERYHHGITLRCLGDYE